MAKRKKSVRTPVKRHSASKPRKRTADVDLKKDNARLKRELKQAREARFREAQQSVDYQTATADVLNVISRSTMDVQPVFDAIARSAARLFEPCEATDLNGNGVGAGRGDGLKREVSVGVGFFGCPDNRGGLVRQGQTGIGHARSRGVGKNAGNRGHLLGEG